MGAVPVAYEVTFSEPVTGFALADVDAVGSTVGGTLGATLSGSGATYTVAVSGMTTAGDVVLAVVAGAAVDGAGNANLASTSVDNVVRWEPTLVDDDNVNDDPDPGYVDPGYLDPGYLDPGYDYDYDYDYGSGGPLPRTGSSTPALVVGGLALLALGGGLVVAARARLLPAAGRRG